MRKANQFCPYESLELDLLSVLVIILFKNCLKTNNIIPANTHFSQSLENRGWASLTTYIALIFAFFVYSLASVFSKGASTQGVLSWAYLWRVACAIGVLGVYALLWQQIIKRMPVSDAYMFKGTSLIFILLLSHIVFEEIITIQNIIGSILIIGGIALYAKS